MEVLELGVGAVGLLLLWESAGDDEVPELDMDRAVILHLLPDLALMVWDIGLARHDLLHGDGPDVGAVVPDVGPVLVEHADLTSGLVTLDRVPGEVVAGVKVLARGVLNLDREGTEAGEEGADPRAGAVSSFPESLPGLTRRTIIAVMDSDMVTLPDVTCKMF